MRIPGWPLRSHTGQCIKCQAHVASVRATRRRLAELGNEQVATPVGFESQIMERLESRAEPQAPNGRWVTGRRCHGRGRFWLRSGCVGGPSPEPDPTRSISLA